MPTPVSCFSPFTPFTPASNAHGSGGYFDRPTPINVASPLSRRPALGGNNCSSSNSTRLSRVSAPTDSPRQPAENGWRIATRMREEAFIAWEQQVKNTNSNNITLHPRQFPNKPSSSYTQHLGEKSYDKPRSVSNLDSAKQSPLPSRPSLRLALHAQDARTCSDGLIEKIVPPNLHHSSTSFDPTSSNNANRSTHSLNILGEQRLCFSNK